MISTAFAYVATYGDEFENIMQEYVDDECMSKADMKRVIKASKSDHPMMRIAWRLRGTEPLFLGDICKLLD